MISLSIIIVSYNNLDVLIGCLDSIIDMNDIGDKLEVIVVEQSSTPNIYNYVKKTYPKVITIKTDNQGFGSGNNRGAEIARGKYLLFLNPDTILIEPICQFAINKFKTNPNLGLFGVQLLDAQRQKSCSFDCIVPYGLTAKILFYCCYKLNVFVETKMYIQGADLFVRADLFNKIGRFDENIFMYCEESDLCLRIINAGYCTSFDSEKEIIHLQGACSSEKFQNTFLKQLHSFQYLCKKFNMPFKEIIMRELWYQRLKCWFLRIINKNDINSFKTAEHKVQVLAKIWEG